MMPLAKVAEVATGKKKMGLSRSCLSFATFATSA
jgi:hypothetical protein